jgi:hypothetical protein
MFVISLPHFAELGGSLPCLQGPSLGSYPEPDQSNPFPSSILFFGPKEYRFLGYVTGLRETMAVPQCPLFCFLPCDIFSCVIE